MRAPVCKRSARSPVKIVTSSGRGRDRILKSQRVPGLAPSSRTVSIGMRPRYSTRSATSAAVEAAIDPLTTSPLGVRAR